MAFKEMLRGVYEKTEAYKIEVRGNGKVRLEMSNLEKYDEVFLMTFDVSINELGEDFVFGSHNWDSLAHMTLVAALEDAFDILLEPDDITHFGSYENGKNVLGKYGVDWQL